MARWDWRKGGGIESLYERTCFSEYFVAAEQLHPDYRVPPTTTLAEIVDELGLVPFSRCEEDDLRFALGSVIGTGMKIFELSEGLQINQAQTILRRIGQSLTAAWAGSVNEDELGRIEQTLQGAETGFRHVHDTAIALLITNTLAGEIGEDKARDTVVNFRKRMRTVAQACGKAAEDLNKIKGREGRPSLDWYRDFQRILTCIAEKNSISPTVEISRETGEPQGRFIELVERFEKLLPPMLRSPSPAAMAKRLQRGK